MSGQVRPSGDRLGDYTSTSLYSSLIGSSVASGIPKLFSSYSDSALDEPDTVPAADADSKVKTKLLSMWNNVKYGWSMKIKTNFSKESPVWLLGVCYYKKSPDALEKASEAIGLDKETNSELSFDVSTEEGIEAFKKDFTSRLWLTYRREFPILNGSTFTTDCGWGCMLRSGQMMLAQALICHFLGRDWRWNPESKSDSQMKEDMMHRKIIKWFGDHMEPDSPFSIHRLVSLGASTGKKAGDWYGPASVAQILCQAVKLSSSAENSPFKNLAAYVSQDCAVYLDDVRAACEIKPGVWKSLILLVPLRLGADKLNPCYASCLTSLLKLEACIGVIGGRPRHSLYFIGFQDDRLIHLDPHYCQETVDVLNKDFPLASFHCSAPRKMQLYKMDPSCCVGFYLQDKEAFDTLIKMVQPSLIPRNEKTEYPMFLFCEGSRNDVCRQVKKQDVQNSRLYSVSSSGKETCEDANLYESEEFEIVPN